ncbi:hypothetical protein [Pseudophaeobacter sp. C1-32P7]|uniref:hypothetical protein n=1 Tax=Pseudophaeobacter sp. C1-32P7 TaxID=3098142 RepID=UPI0034D3EB84
MKSMTYTRSNIEAKLDQLAQIIAGREDGRVFLPLYQRLEAELAALETAESDMDRILRRAADTRDRKFAIAA